MASPLSELAEIAAIFRAQQIPYALIGGWAVNVWGFLRASDDFDFLAELSPSRRKQLIAALPKDWKAEWIAPGIDDPIAGLLRIVPKEGLPIDVLLARGADHGTLSRAVDIEIDGGSIRVVTPEDLIAMKLDAGGGQDYEDARRLLSILGAKVDEAALRERCREREVLERLAIVMKER